ncbi:Na+/H+ antiporter [Antrihabitans sp. YC2-6]|uniref:Na+/H+ antiporter n=1 Tax=Antrihabitans sp. YC2-6 TaxID=2799498 RepID=UPI0018F3E6A8|nr:Na+/H+ antiporter [Antrihabitans sp. YC2-6]MBJ8344685.1 Na+/H+ antiporter [Antrihabitans sp. YC2-6]
MVGQVWFVAAMLAVIVLARGVGERTGVPFSILLTLAGLVYAVLPGPKLQLDPEVVLVLVLPPLLYSTARGSSLLAIRGNLRPIVSLSVLLVMLTAFATGALVALVVPGMPLAVGIVLGAAIAPPDPVAALSVGRRAGMPPRLSVLIEGEGLLNDATALTTYQVAVAAAVGGGFSWAAASGSFVLAVIGGLAVGAAIALLIRALRPLFNDPLIGNAVSLAVPFVTYLVAEEIHASGILAVVVAGLMIGHDAGRAETGASRLQTGAVWSFVAFLLEGFIFLLIGQQLPDMLRGLQGREPSTVITAAVVTVAAVLLLRPMWLLFTQWVPAWFHARLGEAPGERLGGRELLALSWAGTRGVMSLAAIFAVPLTTEAGEAFPDRDLLLFCTYVVVLVTLVGQGLTFAPLLRILGVRANAAEEEQLRNNARLAAIGAALVAVDDLLVQDRISPALADGLRANLTARTERYQRRIDSMVESPDGAISWPQGYEDAITARHEVIEAQRQELLRWRDSGRLPDSDLRKLRRELDYEERTLPGSP